jgi:hypothetical protein
MKALTLFTLCAALLVGSTSYIARAQQTAVSKTVSVPNLTVSIAAHYTAYVNRPVLFEEFSTNDPQNHSLYCVSGYLDVHYILRDSSGKVVPINKEPWKMGSDIPYGTETGFVPGAPDACKTVKTARAERRVLLTDLYPGLRHGSYSLQITLAPRGRSDHATSAPMTVTIQ